MVILKITLELDDELVQEVLVLTSTTDHSEAVTRALRSFINRQKIRGVLELRGKVNIDRDWEELRELEKGELS